MTLPLTPDLNYAGGSDVPTRCDNVAVNGNSAGKYPAPCSPSSPPPCYTNPQCNCTWNTSSCQWDCENPQSPIIIDLAGNGFNLTNAANGVNFDLDGDGIKQRLGWTSFNSDDAWLALDRNGNGIVDNGHELFGNFTPQPAPPLGQEINGFLALAEFDKPANGGNGDEKIDSRDPIFQSLRLWRDVNHDGVCTFNELSTLTQFNVIRFDLNYSASRLRDRNGNQFRYRARVRDAQGAHLGRWAWDVFLVSGN